MPTTLQGHALCRRLGMYTDGPVRLLVRTTANEDIFGYLSECGDDFITLHRDPDRKVLECFIAVSQIVTVRLLHEES
ncbi:MAG: hypothetical protein GEEBNDBF_00563 [bacterium]|nr:hypothetical protein [bacterium]